MTSIILQIIDLPKSFLEKKTKSIYDLLLETNYSQVANTISIEDIYAQLKTCDDATIDFWLEYSSAKRVPTGWYFKKDDKKYEVGFLNTNQTQQICKFADKRKACAHFIKNEVDSILI